MLHFQHCAGYSVVANFHIDLLEKYRVIFLPDVRAYEIIEEKISWHSVKILDTWFIHEIYNFFRDKDAICAIQINGENAASKKICTVHIFKDELEGRCLWLSRKFLVVWRKRGPNSWNLKYLIALAAKYKIRNWNNFSLVQSALIRVDPHLYIRFQSWNFEFWKQKFYLE